VRQEVRRVNDRLVAVRRAVPEPVKQWRRSLRRVVHSTVDSLGLYPDPAECPVCGLVVGRFLPFQGGGRPPGRASDPVGDDGAPAPEQRRCPGCGSLERHRAVWLYFQRRTNLFTAPVKMLHVAPESGMRTRLSACANIDYLTADLNSPATMVRMDITDIQYPDDSFDVILASDVLEHIPADEQAMRELRRVMRPGGWAILQVPIWGEETQEDLSIVDPAERERRYGHFDHVRMYGHDGEYERRLRRSGFDVTVEPFAAEVGSEEAHRYRLRVGDDIHLCTKAAG
jgi:hypothetical protein